MIIRIARKEFTEMVRDGRFRWTSLIIFALLLISLAVGWKSYHQVKTEHETAQRAVYDQWLNQGSRNPHSAAHYGVYVFKPKSPLSLIDQGLDPYTGTAIWLEAHYQNPSRYRPAEDATAIQRFGELTAAIILQLLVPLLIILLTFSAFSGEHEQGTMRQLLSTGLKRRDLAVGKALGIATALGILLIPATVVGVIALALTSDGELFRASIPRMLLMAVGYLLYFGAILGLSLAVSAVAPSSRISLVILLAFWIGSGLLIPRLASDTAERIHHAPTAHEFWAAVERDKQQGVDGHDPANERTKELERKVLAQYGVKRAEDLPVNLDGIRLQAGEEYTNLIYDKHYGKLWSIYERQERIHKAAALFAPLIATRLLSMGLAGTDFAHHKDFSIAAEQYRRTLNRMMNDDFAYGSRGVGYAHFADRDLWAKVPEFSYKPPSVDWVLRHQIWNLSILLLWLIATFIAAIVAASRLKV